VADVRGAGDRRREAADGDDTAARQEFVQKLT
jgi:hypothetical protein